MNSLRDVLAYEQLANTERMVADRLQVAPIRDTPLVPLSVPSDLARRFQAIADFSLTAHTPEEHRVHLLTLTPAELGRITFFSGDAASGAVIAAWQIARGHERSDNPLPLYVSANCLRAMVMRQALTALTEQAEQPR